MATGEGAKTSEETIANPGYMRSRFPDDDNIFYNFDQKTGVKTIINGNTTNILVFFA